MANEKLSYEIAALYTGNAAIKQAFDDFAKLNAQGARVTNELNKLAKQSADTGKEIRNARAGFAQLGVQVNQFGTQLAGGTSFATAFTQQIGDVGFALSGMSGKIGLVGTLLAGPLGLALGAATFALAKMFEETENNSKAHRTLEEVLLDEKSAYAEVNKAVTEYNKKIVESSRLNIQALQLRATAINQKYQEAKATRVLLQAELERRKLSQEMNPAANLPGAMGDAGVAQVITTRSINRVTMALAENQAAINNLNTAATNVIGEIGVEVAKLKTDPVYRLTEGFKALRVSIQNSKLPLPEKIKRLSELNVAEERATDAIKASGRERKNEQSAYDQAVNQRDQLIGRVQKVIEQYNSETSAIGKAKTALRQFKEAQDDLGKLPGGADWLAGNQTAINKATQALSENANGLAGWRAVVAEMNAKELPEWEKRLNKINEAYGNMDANIQDGAPQIAERNALVTGVAMSQVEELFNKVKQAGEKTKDPLVALNEELAVLVNRLSGAQFVNANLEEIANRIDEVAAGIRTLEIEKRNAEFQKSFESLGQSVSDAFKGMLTAGASWKDGMRGIIQTVIDELWRLFVVQQIVGMVGNLFGGGLGGGITGAGAAKLVPGVDKMIGANPSFFANGTVNAPGGMAWVGERGPELVNLPKGSQVIPTHRTRNMATGGINITVDARGSADPAAVRAQVQQGILEAAPAIIAAAESRTVQNMRRPRLGGVMQ